MSNRARFISNASCNEFFSLHWTFLPAGRCTWLNNTVETSLLEGQDPEKPENAQRGVNQGELTPEQAADRNVFLSGWKSFPKLKEEIPSCQLGLIGISEWRVSLTVCHQKEEIRMGLGRCSGPLWLWQMNFFYLKRGKDFSLGWSPAGVVRWAHTSGSGLIQSGGCSAEDLSQFSESLWHHRLVLKGLRLVCPSVCPFPQRLGRKIFLQ